MTTLEELVVEEPAPTHGALLPSRPATSGVWRFALQLADPSAGTDVEWFDLTGFYAGDTETRGAARAWGRNQPATGQVTLQVDQESADEHEVILDILAPYGIDTSDLFGVDVELDGGLVLRFVLFRVVGGVTVEWEPVWTGRVETWGDSTAALGQIRTHVVTWVDTIGDLVDVPVPAVSGPDVDIEARIDELMGFSSFPFGYDVYCDAEVVTDMPERDAQPSMLAELDLNADSVGLLFRSRRNGRLVFHPAPWDTQHDGWPNPLFDVYPSGVTFSHNPDTGEVAFIADDDASSFGIQRSSLGVVNNIVAALPGGPYLVDDAVSMSKFGVKTLAVTSIVENETAIDELLAARAYASAQALPMRVSSDHEGFWPAMSLLDHVDPITIVWASGESGVVVTAPGYVRQIRSDRFWLGQDLNWISTIQFDLTSSTVSPALLPVEDLAASPEGYTAGFEATWTNPSGQPVTPTDTQIRLLGWSPIWFDYPYPITTFLAGALDVETTYELQVRLVRRVSGIVTHQSPIRSVTVTTLPGVVIVPGPDGGGDTGAEWPGPADGCDWDWELQENDGSGWSTILTGDQDSDEVTSLDPPTVMVDESYYDADKVYRFRFREVCGGTPGDWETGPSFDPPDDWADPCPDPPALGDSPFDDASLRVYFPQVCAPDTIGVLVYD